MSKRTYGTLRLIDGGKTWEMAEIEPHVAIRLKQLFPRIPKVSVSPFHFPNDIAHAADIDWFTSRYPLRITDQDRAALKGGRLEFEWSQAEMEQILLPDWRPPPFLGLREGQEVRHYQAQIPPILKAQRGVLLGDEGGVGKTYTAAACMLAIPEGLPAAVVVQVHLQKQWAEKIEAFTTLRVHKIKGTKPYDLSKYPADVYVFRYSQIAGWADVIGQGPFKMVVFDEPQELRTGSGTQKGAAAKLLHDCAIWRLGLTGTPIFGWGSEIWNVLQVIRPEVLGSYDDFTREWCTYIGNNKWRVNDPKALGTYLREQFAFIRRTKRDVGKEMPPVNRIIEYVGYDAEAVRSVEELAHQLAIKATSGSFIERGQAARDLDIMVRQTTGIAKAPFVADFVRILVEAGEPVVLWGWHRAVYDIWLERLADLNPAMYTGSETATQKDRGLQAFLNGETDILIMSLRSGAGTDGIQHRCSTGVLGELDWTHGAHQQCTWRLDREGQTNPVTMFYLVTEDGSDPPMMEVLGLKSSEAVQIVDPHLGVQAVTTDETHMQKLIQRYLAKKGRHHTAPLPEMKLLAAGE